MKKLLTLTLALAMVCVCALAAAEMGPTMNFKLAENQPDGNPITEGMKMFAELANKYTEGTVTIDVYANGELLLDDFQPGTLTDPQQLPAGSYALFCNILETEADGSKENHYANGMRARFSARG